MLRRFCLLFLAAVAARAADQPFFVTYTDALEAPTDLEISLWNVAGRAAPAGRFLGTAAEFEYGATSWWTTSLYFDGGYSSAEGGKFTGYRWENRLRPPVRERWLVPAFYVELANVSPADQTLLDVVDREPTGVAEVEGRFILSSHVKGWTFTGNFIAERPLSGGTTDYGYAAAVTHALAAGPLQERCRLCGQNFRVGVEAYGGEAGTAQYIAADLAWSTGTGNTFSVSAGFGVAGASSGFLLRAGLSHEVDDFGRSVRRLFAGVAHR